jgi:hypothetical protein
MVSSAALGLVISFELHELNAVRRASRKVDRPIPIHLACGVSCLLVQYRWR